MNRNLAIAMLNVKPELIKPLEIGVSHTLALPKNHTSDDVAPKTVTVTLIDANHIRGSVMFLFEGELLFFDFLNHKFLKKLIPS